MLINRLLQGIVVLTIGFPTLAMSQDASNSARPAKVFTVHAADGMFTREYPAIVAPSQQAVVTFQVSGNIIELAVLAGQQVKTGDVIARLDPRDFENTISELDSSIDQAMAQLRALRAGARAQEVSALEAAVEAVQAQVDQASEQAKRSRTLQERGIVAASKVESDEATLRVVQAELRAKLEELSIGKSGGRIEDVEAAEAALRGLHAKKQKAQNALNDTTLLAPFDGTVARREVNNFTNIQAGQDIILLQNLSAINLGFNVPAPDVVVFSQAEEIVNQATLVALPGEILSAEFAEFSTQADAATQTYRGEIRLELPVGSRILPGMIGSVIVSTQLGSESAVTAPISAIAATPAGESFVWLLDGDTNTVSKTIVTLGEARGANVDIINGLSDGDVIVSAGVTRLQDGMAIRPITRIGG